MDKSKCSESDRATLTIIEAVESHLSEQGFAEGALGSLSRTEQGLLGEYKNKTILQTEVAFVQEFSEQVKPAYANGAMSSDEVEGLISGLVVDVHLAVLYEWAKNRVVYFIGSKKGKKPTRTNPFGFRIGDNLDTTAIAVLMFGNLRIDEPDILATLKVLEPLREKVKQICIK